VDGFATGRIESAASASGISSLSAFPQSPVRAYCAPIRRSAS